MGLVHRLLRRGGRRRNRELVGSSGLFDTQWYLARHPDVAASGADPVAHFLSVGTAEGHDPNPLFDTKWYLARYPEVTAAGGNALLHFIAAGAAEGRDPHPLFDTKYYVARCPELVAAGLNPLAHFIAVGAAEGRDPNPLFDSKWYLARYPELAAARVNPLVHFVWNGAAEGRDPHPLFSTRWYLAKYPDLAAAGVNPLAHFIWSGAAEGRDPHPLFDIRWYLAANPDVAASGENPVVHFTTNGGAEGRNPHPLFDTKWYVSTYPDVAAAGDNPLRHFLQAGAAEGRDPNPLFDTKWYLATYPDVAAAGENPLAHFVSKGASEGRDPNPLFDTKWYLAKYPDVAAAGDNPLAHYLRSGAAEGRNPNPLFYGKWYLAANPDVAAAGENPLAHFIARGANEGRDPNELFDTKWYRARYPDVAAAGHNPLAHYIARGVSEGRDPNPLFDTKWYLAANPDVAVAGANPLAHFLAVGAAEGRNPNPLFDTRFYLAKNPDVAAAGDNALAHYLTSGAAEGRNPNPLFDSKWYLAANPDVAAAGDNPLVHFIESGAAEGRDPSPGFNTRHYLTAYPDVAAGHINPLDHYLRMGAAEGRKPLPVADTREGQIERIARAAMFDDAFYRAQHGPRLAGATPLEHFLLTGEAEGALPYANYSRAKMHATLRARGVPLDGRPFVSFVDSQVASFAGRVAQAQRNGRPTWVTPVGMRFSMQDGGESRLIDAGAPPSERPALLWQIDGKSPTAFVIPFIAPGDSVESLVISTKGHLATDVPFSLTISKDLAAPLATRSGRFEFRSLGIRWDLSGIALEKGRRYFLQLSAPQSAGLELAARAFYPAEPVARAGGDLLHAAIVTIVYRTAPHIETFLKAVYRQDYPGPMTVVIVEDGSPPDSFADLEKRVERSLAAAPANVAVQIVRNPENLGNCLSRNAGIAACDADFYVIIDSDCLINRGFIRAHIAEHRLPETDAVVGPYNIESNGEDGFSMLQRLEGDEREAVARANMQDELLGNAFVNTVTRNLSIKKAWFDTHGHFDPMLSYSRKPDTGYGWEDVDIGARIYAGRGAIRYTPHAFSVHLTHDSSVPATTQVRGSAKNFHYLVSKHPFIKTAARRWYVDTADRIVTWADAVGASSTEIELLRRSISTPKRAVAPLLPYLRKQKRRYRILTHRWHVPHQYEIYKLPFDFTLLTGTGTGFTNYWSNEQRPLRPNVRMVPAESVDQSDFDMAIVHFDENVLSSDLSNGVLGSEWGDTFRWFMENIKLPMVAVCHGTLPFVGQYAANPDAIRNFELYRSDADALRAALANTNVVVNSYQAGEEWKFRRSRVIWHGLDPQEFVDGSHERDIVHHGADLHRPHYRGLHALREVLGILEADKSLTISSHKHKRSNAVAQSDPRFSELAFQSWLRHVGRHKIYLNTTLRSPMPRSRTEAMLCGTIPVSLDNHDVSRFIQNGVNGFYSSSVEELADFCKTVCHDERMRTKISAAARATAMDTFNHDRFLTEWVKLVEETLGA